MIIYAGLVWMFEPAWNVEASVRAPELIITAIDCKQEICPSYVEKEVKTKQKTIKGYVTCYTNLPELTDDSPDFTANGQKVYVGGVAANGYRFNSKVQIEGVTYIVNDRKNSRYGPEWFDIFVESYQEAVNCGVKELDVTIL